jgi:hypothetical protein
MGAILARLSELRWLSVFGLAIDDGAATPRTCAGDQSLVECATKRRKIIQKCKEYPIIVSVIPHKDFCFDKR